MTDQKAAKIQLYTAVIVLTALALWAIFYKVTSLGFELVPDQREAVWLVEAKIEGTVLDSNAEVSFAIPKESSGFSILGEQQIGPGYGMIIDETDGDRRVIWSSSKAVPGKRGAVYFRVEVYDAIGRTGITSMDEPAKVLVPVYEAPIQQAADTVRRVARDRSGTDTFYVGELLRMLHDEKPGSEAHVLLDPEPTKRKRITRAIELLAMDDIPARVVRGVHLEEGARHQPISMLLEVYVDEGWRVFDPVLGVTGIPKNFVLWQHGGQSLLDVVGIEDSRVRFSVIKEVRPGRELAGARADERGSMLLDLWVYSLPIEHQNVFKKLLLVPLGVLVVTLMRNIVGVKTSGTFMPVLIALAFFETTLVGGLIIFTVVVGCGLGIRNYLTNLNLLVVPRVSAVVIVVIILMGLMSVISFKLGIEGGLTVTFFPMIIIAWTIERLSIAWEEQGSGEALMQTAGSLFVAAIAYVCTANPIAEHICYAFPEVSLIILAMTLLVGSYTGYRLTELRRFEPLIREDQEAQ